MNMPKFSAEIIGNQIHCSVTSATLLIDPIFCFSLMAPPAVESGGILIREDGGYGEVKLPDLKAGLPHEFILCYADPTYKPRNRAWLPLGAYLRCGEDIIELPKLPAGVATRAPVPFAQVNDLCLVPKPHSWAPSGGFLAIQSVKQKSPLWTSVDALALRCNLSPLQEECGVSTSLKMDDTLPADGYRIAISEQGLEIRYGGHQGAHYAGVTLLVLRETNNGNIPCGVIEDHPSFDWRGQHLDCARHFYKVESIFKLMDVMALLKMNRFHWHFSDDEAFRLELQSVPDLATKTSLRGENQLVPGVFGGGPKSGGTYCKEDAKAIVEHGKSVFIEVLPEIEFPAHALAITRAFPETRDENDTGTETSVQGYSKNVLNPAIPETWEIIEAMAEEVCTLFPFGMLHVGADELPEGTWMGSPAVHQLKSDEELESADDVLGWSLHRLAEKLAIKGIRCAAWEEAARGKNGGIGNNALLYSWSGQQAGIEAAKSGYDIIMCPAQNVYLDMAHTDNVDDWGAAWAAFVGLTDTIDWAVIPDDEIADRVLGVEGTFWSEFTTQDQEMQAMIAPRIIGVASKGWVDEPLAQEEFLINARRFCEIFTKMEWSWNTACFSK